MKVQRMLAVIGLILMVVSIVLMIAGLFTGAAKELMMQISLFSFLGAVAILLVLSVKRKQASKPEPKDEE